MYIVSKIPVCGVDMIFEELVLPEGGCADSALVGQVSRLQGLAVILGYMVQQLPLVHLKSKWHT
jgi:hypothetical protein